MSPLRVWLLSTSLLAVIAGYSLLFAFNQGVAGWQRRQGHDQLVAQLVDEIQGRSLSLPQLEQLAATSLIPYVQLQVLPASRQESELWLHLL
jgi:hypothetical protein